MDKCKTQLEKKQKLLALMSSVIDSPTYKDEFSIFFRKFDYTREAIESAFLDYNMDVHSHDNSIYQDHAIRAVLHIHNLVFGSWHIERQNAVCKLVRSASASKAIDLGFGVPSRYVKELLALPTFVLTLCDYQPGAINFAETLLNYWDKEWQQKIILMCENIENVPACAKDFDLYISLLSIEHVSNPTKCLNEYVKYSLSHAKFLIEIPIGPITPEHNMAWSSDEESRAWVDSVGLKVIDEQVTWVNPAVDLFAEVHDFKYSSHLMLCQKK